jgi:hypothetical protein
MAKRFPVLNNYETAWVTRYIVQRIVRNNRRRTKPQLEDNDDQHGLEGNNPGKKQVLNATLKQRKGKAQETDNGQEFIRGKSKSARFG